MIISDFDIKNIEKFVEIRNQGFYASGKEVTEVYNRVLQKKVAVTNCGSCIRQRIDELSRALAQFKALSAQKKEEQPKEEEPKKDKPITKKKPGRPKKK